MPDHDDVTEDRMLGGKILLQQARKGYRAGADAALLAAAVGGAAGERLLEAGCGPGAALLQAALRAPEASFVGLEREAAALALAQANIAAAGLGERVGALQGDVGAGFARLGQPAFDGAFSNPPFFDDRSAIRGPAPERDAAYMADDGLAAWTRFLLKAVRPGGRIVVIHRADRLADLLALLGGGAGSFRIRPIQPFADAPAKRVLIRGLKTGKAPLVLLPALVLHERDGAKHTPAAEAILRGDAPLGWD